MILKSKTECKEINNILAELKKRCHTREENKMLYTGRTIQNFYDMKSKL